MNNLKVLGAAAALALILPLATPSFAQGGPGGHGGGGHMGGGGGAHFGGGGGGARMGGGSFGGGPRIGGGASFSGGAAMRPGGGNFAMRPGGGGPAFNSGSRPVASAGNWSGGGGHWNGGGNHWHGGGYRHHGGGGFWPGFAAGAAIGGLGSYAYYGGGYYNDPYYYGDSYYDEPSVAVVQDTDGGDSTAYCAQRFKSYDPASGTYLGYDGQRHPCP